MKKLISCLLAVMMILSAVSAFAAPVEDIEKTDVLRKFLKETDLTTKDIALQVQSGEATTDLVIRVDKDNLHLVSRNNGAAVGHLQLNPTGIYVGSDSAVTLLRYATVATVLDDLIKDINEILDAAIKSIPELPEDQKPSEEEIKKAVNELAVAAEAAAAQEATDSVTLSSAAVAFANRFRPEYVLDVKDEDGTVKVSLRSEAFAAAFADAMDELMANPAMAELVDRRAATTGGKSFAKYQKEWEKYREDALAAIKTIESSDAVSEDGHWQSHFQLGEEAGEEKPMVCDSDTWIDPEGDAVETKISLGLKDEDPFMVYELAVDENSYFEKLTALGNSFTEVQMDFDNAVMTGARIKTEIEGNEELYFEFGPDYLYMKGPKAAISTSVRETWTGKIRYDLYVETADGKEESITLDFYEDGDSLVCELMSGSSDQSAKFMLSRVDKLEIEDLSASQNITEITVEAIEAQLTSLLNMFKPTETTETEAK